MATLQIANQNYNTNLVTALGSSPSAGDTVYVDKYSVDYADGILSAVDLAVVEATPGFRGRFATSAGGGQLKVVADRTSTGVFRNKSNSPRIELISTSSSGVIYNIVQMSAAGVLNVNTCDNQNLYVVKGTCQVESGADVSSAWCYPGGSLALRYATYLLAKLWAVGGSVYLQRDLTDMDIGGSAEVTIEQSAVSPSGTVNVFSGTLNVIESGTIASLNGYTGVINFSQLRSPVTVSARNLHPGVTLVLSRNSPPITWSAINDVAGGPQTQYVD